LRASGGGGHRDTAENSGGLSWYSNMVAAVFLYSRGMDGWCGGKLTVSVTAFILLVSGKIWMFPRLTYELLREFG